MALPAMDPYSAVISGAVQGLTSGAATADQKQSSAFDSSGWNINFGSGSITSDRKQAGALSDYMPYLLLGAGLLVVWRFTRRK
jgi:hypothetical protein